MERQGIKFEHYFKAYEDKFIHIKPNRLLEIGVQSGLSLKYWNNLFPLCNIVGVDIDPNCLKHSDINNNIEVIIGNQADEDFLNTLGNFDIIIDDGGHSMTQQLTSFKNLFPKLNDGGIYVIEDLHTSYWKEFGGSFGEYTTIDFLKTLIDDVNCDFALKVNRNRCDNRYDFTNRYNIESLTFYESLVFITKQKQSKNYKL
jgi:cephalosporin hydroxylase